MNSQATATVEPETPKAVRSTDLVRQQLVESIKSEIKNIGCIYRSVGDALYDEPIIRLAERIAENLGRDSVRLDWLETNQESIFSWTQDDQYGEPNRKLWQCHSAGLEKARDNIRDAIDAAMLPNVELSDSRPKQPTT